MVKNKKPGTVKKRGHCQREINTEQVFKFGFYFSQETTLAMLKGLIPVSSLALTSSTDWLDAALNQQLAQN